MENVRVLFISQEITPYLPESEMALIGRYLPQGIQERGREIRTFMPRFGNINERRNQLHEVIRLSGMNLIIDDTDHPLIIKVASIQSARMQVYFIDNEDYFNRKYVLKDSKNKHYKDNDERMIFFARGVIETVKKLRWSPDIIHCHGWFTSLVPLYIKKSYNDDPLFMNSKVLFSAYNEAFNDSMDESFVRKVKFDGITDSILKELKDPTFTNIARIAFRFSDGIIMGSKNLPKEIDPVLKEYTGPVLKYQDPEDYIDSYSVFYDKILNVKKV
jgi:starch synthase